MNFFVRTEKNVYVLERLSLPKVEISPEVSHHILVVDRSGSMYSDIEALKQSIEQSLAVESMTKDETLVSLISFSTHGDVTLHWSKVSVSKIMELNQPYLNILRGIKATYLTGISQALHMALQQVDLGQTTGITLFTDGYANSPSSYEENKNLDAFVLKASEAPGLFLNCIGYRDWCDWPRLNAMSNALSGKTLKANSFKDVLSAMRDTQTLLSGNVRPSITVQTDKEKMVLAINRTTGQVNLATESITIRGASSEDNVEVYSVARSPKDMTIPKGLHVLEKDSAYLFGALSVGYTNVSDLRAAKELLFASGNKTLWEEHQAAITPSSLTSMLSDLTAWVKAGKNEDYEMGRNTRPKFSLFTLAEEINSLPRNSIGLPSEEFYKNYRRRSVKKMPGTREEDGTITPPRAELVAKEGARRYVSGMSFNDSDASVQLNTHKEMNVKRLSDGQIFREVKFVALDKIRDYRDYTLISSGERNVEVLPLEVYNKQAWEALQKYVRPSEVRDFELGGVIRIPLKRFRMDVDEAPELSVIQTALENKFRATAMVKAYSAMVNKEEASPYTPEQVEALKELHLTPALYFSAPSTNPYVDRDEAIAKGEIDSYTRYRVNFGTTSILSTGEFRSGNAFLKRRYVTTNSNGEVVKDAKLDTYLQGATYSLVTNSKAKDTAADKIMAREFDSILLTGEKLTNEELSATLKNYKDLLEVSNEIFRPLVMEIGCTGLLPADLGSLFKRYEPEEFSTKFGVSLGKDEKEGVFYVEETSGIVISISPETSWYST